MTNDNSAPFAGSQHWQEKIFQADAIWQQVKAALAQTRTTLENTPRRPDVRLIVKNISGQDISFQNPGQHSDKPETVPSQGDNTAAMIMLAGDNLSDQHLNAFMLYNRFNLATNGLTPDFAAFLATPEAKQYLAEAYGPAPFDAQSKKLVQVDWTPRNRPTTSVTPVFATAASFGARAATHEKVLIVTTDLYIQGTNTTPELMENSGMAIAITDGKDGANDKTRPIVPSVAEDFYGADYDRVPIAHVNTDGQVECVDLRNGSLILLSPQGAPAKLVHEDAGTSNLLKHTLG